MRQELERKFYLRHFKAISHAISTYDDLSVLTDHLAEGTSRRFKAKGCSIMLLDERDRQLYHVSNYGISEEYLNKGPIFLNEKYSAMHKGEPVFVEDMQNDHRVQYPEAAAKEGIVSMLSIPIKCRKAVIGVLRIYYDTPIRIHDEDIDTLCVMSEHLGLVIENNGLKNFLEGVKTALESLPPRMLKGL
ncbi:MAG: GAF domain-containing protein [Desulfobacterales bacterium]|jgi:signal transduction protein with GAF and PtsI domain